MPKQHYLIRNAITIALLSACLGGMSSAWGQEVSASITGTVVDPTGASVVDANIIAKDAERGTTYTAQTNSVGVFNLPRVPVGIYELKVEAPGFQTAVYRSVVLVLNQTARVDFSN